VRRGLRLLAPAITAFEKFVASLGHDLYFVEPLYYHNAVIFERYGFTYQMGRKLMERIETGFAEKGDLYAQLDSSSPFRRPEAKHSIRLRSWAIHDGILGEPFTSVTMYKRVGKTAGLTTCPSCTW
jgi:acetoin utilization protein AcuC